MLESKRRAIIFLVISFLLAAAAGFLMLKKVRDMNAQLGEMVEIYVAAKDIPSRSLIQPDQVEARLIPKKYAEGSYVTDKRTLQGMVSVIPLSQGDVLTRNMIKPATTVRDQNNRLVTVFASGNVVFDQELEALDRVDIIISHDKEGRPVTEVFMQDVPVAMVAKSGDEFRGVALELPFTEVPRFIHQQHYADVMRILKANVGKGEPGIPEPLPTDQPAETEQKPDAQPGGTPPAPGGAGAGSQPNPASNTGQSNSQTTPANGTSGGNR